MPSELAQRFARVIESTGPISVAQYMGEANAAYYASRDPLGAAGDFITAPEISQMFGEMIGLWFADLFLRSGYKGQPHYVELGPGRGTLANDALNAMAKFGVEPKVHFVEFSPALREKQAALRPDAIWHDMLDTLPRSGALLVMANEFYDALPVRQLIATHAGWRERVVARNGERFMALPGARPMDAVVPEQFRNAQQGSILETCPAASGFAYELSTRIAAQGGAMLTIDYGYDTPQLGSTLQAVRAHEKVDPFSDPGECDLTAHVNFDELKQIGLSQGLNAYGPVGQGAFLKALGIQTRTQMLSQQNPDHAEALKAAQDRLINEDDSAMGELFRVLAVTGASWPAPEGFA
ncbi:class I SAM-dependent methyltransferase [Alterisphingorhabdus coralli]|uniref:SAM-dependent methyltransferase n=1 Tax=Alterisphingorhabdus coralli TaxID=3071408 RepID=A0AA97F6D2_9SPHN|nr:SAM-dependent methyltransferase [Parasphingorhabdus sp. SCSIO 66989]WOE75189.1 SAM-dependent methyltransferase [Parasphingorhabdus sp. SCSIO 66989]